MRQKRSDVQRRVGKNIRHVRRARGWSQEQLAERVGLTGKQIGQIERGKVDVGINRLASVADALAVGVHDLVRSLSDDPTESIYAIVQAEFAQLDAIVTRLKRTRARRGRAK